MHPRQLTVLLILLKITICQSHIFGEQSEKLRDELLVLLTKYYSDIFQDCTCQ